MNTVRTPHQIIGDDAYVQLVFEGYEVIAADALATLTAERDEARRQRDEIGRAWDSADARAKAAEAQNERLRKALGYIRDYPPATSKRRDEEGYPLEVVYDEFAYRRIVDSYREFASRSISQDGEERT